MAKIISEFETKYDRGDAVIFRYHDRLMVGIISGYYIDHDAGASIWYDIAINNTNVLNYAHGGDIAEWDIIGKIDDVTTVNKVFSYIQKGNWDDTESEIEIELKSESL